ncbi:transcription elongation factor GreAB [Paenisporosarcina sp. OV554]|uniref:transcription elongation factor GreAB n=1 Tax=Paenisporosarcina sp. OV554 TaxID=2135694 RepID=UPI000D3A27C0|nr:transcription elongation factor GreAB [Paenisporosarcina sp. OV554]PUB10756.1 hypothetical protein C8K15_11619 [Paenisporosarcina sp. OV554]
MVIAIAYVCIGCTEKLPVFEEYTGRTLDIAVIGAAPDIGETNVTFEEFSMNDLLFMDFSEYDAVFIMKEHLEEASAAEYAEVYTSSKIPFFFIESTKGSFPFSDAEALYSNSHERGGGTDFAAGYMTSSDSQIEGTTYGFGLYNDIKNDETVKGTYSIIFNKIQEIVK